MQNKCFNCKWWFNCKKADTRIENCEWFEPQSYADKLIEEVEKEIRY